MQQTGWVLEQNIDSFLSLALVWLLFFFLFFLFFSIVFFLVFSLSCLFYLLFSFSLSISLLQFLSFCSLSFSFYLPIYLYLHLSLNSNFFLLYSGQVLRSNPKMTDADKYATNMLQLTNQARGVVRDLDPKNELRYLRVRTKELEYMVAFGESIFFSFFWFI